MSSIFSPSSFQTCSNAGLCMRLTLASWKVYFKSVLKRHLLRRIAPHTVRLFAVFTSDRHTWAATLVATTKAIWRNHQLAAHCGSLQGFCRALFSSASRSLLTLKRIPSTLSTEEYFTPRRRPFPPQSSPVSFLISPPRCWSAAARCCKSHVIDADCYMFGHRCLPTLPPLYY